MYRPICPKKEKNTTEEVDSVCEGGPQELEDGFFGQCKMEMNRLGSQGPQSAVAPG